MKLPVIRNVEAIGVESERGSAILAEGVSHQEDGVGQPVERVRQPAESDRQLPKSATQPADPLLLLTAPVNSEPRNEASDFNLAMDRICTKADISVTRKN